MSIKSLTRKVTARAGRQILTVKTHSPVLLFGVGLVGVTATTVLACRATLKMSELLEEGEKELVDTQSETGLEDETKKKLAFNVRLQVAIKIAKLYAPAVIVGVASVGALTGSHIILRKRNAGLAAAYTVLDKIHKDYRGRVIKDQGAEKDFEYLHGVEEREIVEETKDGPVVKNVKGLDQEAIKKEDPEKFYRRLFDRDHKDWSDIPNQNQFLIEMKQSEANDLLRLQGHVFLNQVYDLLGFEPTAAGQIVGWVKNPEAGEGDGYINFGIWNDGVYKGMQWLNGHSDSVLLDFNVDGPILGALKKV